MKLEAAQQRYERAMAAHRQLEGLAGRREAARRRLQAAEGRASELYEQEVAERADVEALQALTFEVLWTKLTGAHADKLTKEERELHVGVLARREADAAVTRAREALDAIESGAAALEALAADVEEAERAWLALRASEGDGDAAKQIEKRKRRSLLADDAREIEEALNAAKVLDTVDEHLKGYLTGGWNPSAERSLAEQMVFGSGPWRGIAPEAHLFRKRSNYAEEHERQIETFNRASAQDAFLRFESELADVDARLAAGGLARLEITADELRACAPSLVDEHGRLSLHQAHDVVTVVVEGLRLLQWLRVQARGALNAGDVLNEREE